jgi:hypothetical protein
MRSIIALLILGLSFTAGFFTAHYYFDNGSGQVILDNSQPEPVMLMPDTVIVDRFIEISKIIRQTDTVAVLKTDTVYVQGNLYRTAFSYSPPEFDASFLVYGSCPADSAQFKYSIKQEYISALVAGNATVQEYPQWKKYSWFCAGLIGAGLITAVNCHR